MRQKTCLLMATAVSLEQARDQEERSLQVLIISLFHGVHKKCRTPLKIYNEKVYTGSDKHFNNI